MFIVGFVILLIGFIALLYFLINSIRSYVTYKAMIKYPDSFAKGCLEAIEEENSSLTVDDVFNETKRLLKKYVIEVIVSLVIILIGFIVLVG